MSGPLALNYDDLLSSQLASPIKPSKPNKLRSATANENPVSPTRILSMDEDSIKEDCGGNNSDEPVVKGPWAKHEDELLRKIVAEQGAKRWTSIAAKLPGRIGKQVRT